MWAIAGVSSNQGELPAGIMGTLFIVATPIGNLSDFSPRAVTVLRDVALIAAEDTRHSRALLRHFDIATSMISYHAFNERSRRDRLLEALDRGDVALISDAGTPAISDPGNDLVAVAHAAGHRVSPVPGPSAMVAAVSASGLVPGPFVMVGFLPRRGAGRLVLLGRSTAAGLPLVLFEAPGRLVETLRDLSQVLGDRDAIVARELTKLHEEVVSGRLSALAERFAAQPPLGEIVVVVGAPAAVADSADDEQPDDEAVVRSLLATGLPVSQVAREAAAVTGRPRSELYALARKLRADAAEHPSGAPDAS